MSYTCLRCGNVSGWINSGRCQKCGSAEIDYGLVPVEEVLSPAERDVDMRDGAKAEIYPPHDDTKGALVGVLGPYFTAGLIVHRDVVVGSAPILRYMVAWKWTEVQSYIEKRGWTWQLIKK